VSLEGRLLVIEPRLRDAVAAVGARVTEQPAVGIVLGSGLSGFADALGRRLVVPYAEVPHLRAPSVAGHRGALTFGTTAGVRVACLAGRVHLYEGHDPADVVFGCRLLAALGCHSVLLTNAAGGIREDLGAGSLLLILDHVNLTGRNPLVGAECSFVDMTHAYDEPLRRAAHTAATELAIPLREGVYAGVLGPSYETPAEIRMLRALGADAVGMSTVLEAIALRAAGVRVGAISVVTNKAAGLSGAALDHREVQEAARRAEQEFSTLMLRWIELAGKLAVEE